VQVVHKMSAAAPPKILVENYMIEIARTYKVPFEPDPLVMMVSVSVVAFILQMGLSSLHIAYHELLVMVAVMQCDLSCGLSVAVIITINKMSQLPQYTMNSRNELLF